MLLALLAACAPDFTLSEPGVVIRGATVLPQGDVRDVVVAGDHIAALLEPGAELDGEVEEIDGADRFLTPGLVDLHVHVWSEGDLSVYLANGVTTIRNLSGDTWHLSIRDDLVAGRRAGPTLITSGPIIDGPEGFLTSREVVRDAEEAALVADLQVQMTFAALKVYDGVPAEAWQALIDAGAQAGVPVVGHIPDEVGYLEAIQGGQRTVEHLDDVLAAAAGMEPFPLMDDPHRTAALEAMTEERIAGVAEATAATGAWSVPTLVVMQSYATADTWDSNDPRLAYMSPVTRASWFQSAENLSPSVPVAMTDVLQFGQDVVAALRGADAPLAVGTDAGNPWVFHGYAVHDELDLLVESGLTPAEALDAATLQAARALGQEEVFGQIAVGQRADLLLVNADPRLDTAALQDRVGVMARGQWYDQGDLDALLAEVAWGYQSRGLAPARPATSCADHWEGRGGL
ncbi:MAG: amidohydrolase family protein [Alphaproteobacteria bacterium]|nr:amidohydrolase family protein [Alphaproteobacteria bacterium]